MSNYQQVANTIWNSAEILHFQFNKTEYRDVILPFTVIKRLDTVLEPTKDEVIAKFNEVDGRLENLDMLMQITGYRFYNTSPYTFKKLLDNPYQIVSNFKSYLKGFSPNVQEILTKFDFDRTLRKLSNQNQLYLLIKEFEAVDVHPDRVSNHDMGLAFEDLIRRFNESANEEAGEHYTPRDVVELMTALAFAGEEEELKEAGATRTLYDPACGTGGMLTVGKDYVQKHFNKKAKIFLYGQEINGKTYAICKSDMLLKGEDADKIRGGDDDHEQASTLSTDQHAGQTFDYIISNPPYGVDWKKDQEKVLNEIGRTSGRFPAGKPRVSDGQFLFIQHIISKFNPVEKGGSDAVVITNGSPLLTGDAGSSESKIRRWMLESDFVDTIIALPGGLFFNTGIGTYIWLLSNRKPKERQGKVMLMDAREIKTPLDKNLGEKRYELNDRQIKKIVDQYKKYKGSADVKVLDIKDLAFRKITIERPLQRNYQVADSRLEKLKTETAFTKLVQLPEKLEPDDAAKALEEGEAKQESLLNVLKSLGGVWYHPKKFLEAVCEQSDKKGLELSNPLKKAIVKALSQHDEEAEIVFDSSGKPEPDVELRDFEYVPYNEDITEFFEREVKPYVPGAWIDTTVVDEVDGDIGLVGYEINLIRQFFDFDYPRNPEIVYSEIEKGFLNINKTVNELQK